MGDAGVVHAGRKQYRLELAYPRQKVCIESDGEEYHSSLDRAGVTALAAAA